MNQIYLMLAMGSAAILGALGQIFMKKGSAGSLGIGALLTNWYLWGFVGCYGIGVLINFFVYRLGGKVQILYPIISLSYVFAAIFAWKLLGESISGWTWAGTFIILVGITIIGIGAST